MTLAHHPNGWLADKNELEEWQRASHFLLTGHEHIAGISQDNRGSLHIASGAVSPSRGEVDWFPAYNLIEMEAKGEAISVDVFSRQWADASVGFDGDLDHPLHFDVPLQLKPSNVPTLNSAMQPDELQPEAIDSSRHSQIYAVMSAPPDIRRRVARRMGLTENSSDGDAVDRLILERAIESERLWELQAGIAEINVD